MQSRTEAYARLLIKTGLNLQNGQGLVIASSVENADFARLCAFEAYMAGCREVNMLWKDEKISRMKYLYADESVFDSCPLWTSSIYNDTSERGDAFLSLTSEDPEALRGVDAGRLRRSSIAVGNATFSFRERQTSGEIQWCIGGVPSLNWAKKVFPDSGDEEALERLWDAILSTSRVYSGSDPVSEWKKHVALLKKRAAILNNYSFHYLEYKNSLGTDLRIALPENHIWEGGDEPAKSGIRFCANIPSEEIFTSPLKTGVNGTVYSSKPLVLNGSIVNNFSFTFKDGRVTELHAETGQELLESAISVDEGASYLGEVALVPYDSPISNSGILFYNTLYDENASCHLALGDSYPCIEGGRDMTSEELQAHGLNSSIEHMDFMIGTADLAITGITSSGERIPVFINGGFVF